MIKYIKCFKIGIAKLEVPLNHWPDLFDILVNTSQNKNKNIRLASIVTLGFLAQEITPKEMNEENIGKSIFAIYQILNDENDKEIVMEAIQAFFFFLPFSKSIFANEANKHIIYKVIIKHTQNDDDKIRYTAFQCLIELGRLYYDYIGDYIPEIMSISLLHVNLNKKIDIKILNKNTLD